MNSVHLLQSLNPDDTVLALSAHCDDVEVGCGGFLRRIKELHPPRTIRGIVFSGRDDPRRRLEEEQASTRFGIGECRFFPYPDTRFPNHWHEIKDDLLALREELREERIGLILCPRLDDRHQDHRVVAENVWRIFRDHLILEYEIPKYEGDMGKPNVYVGLSEEQANAKADLLVECYPSRACHHWWNRETFLATMTLRGVEANTRFAEGLIARKLLI